jgi:beta-glucosidase
MRGSWLSAARVIRTMCRAHLAACRLIHRLNPEAQIGMAHSAPWVMPQDPSSLLDRWVAFCRDLFLNHILLRSACRRIPGGPDFIGLNYYNRHVVTFAPRGLGWIFGIEPPPDPADTSRRFSDTGQEIYPVGLLQVVRRVARYGLPIMITENGLATEDEELRCRYLEDHVAALGKAVGEGQMVLGYIYWTLMDNFEWALGRRARFGLAATDFRSQQRMERPAARLFAKVCASNRLIIDGPASHSK